MFRLFSHCKIPSSNPSDTIKELEIEHFGFSVWTIERHPSKGFWRRAPRLEARMPTIHLIKRSIMRIQINNKLS